MWRTMVIILISLCSIIGKADPYQLFEEKGKYGLKDQQGNILIPASFEALGWSDGSFSIIGEVTGYKLKEQWGLINLKKEFLTKPDYKTIVYPGGDRVIVSKQINPAQVKTGCLNLTGQIKIPFKYDAIAIVGLRAIVMEKRGAHYFYGLTDLEDRQLVGLQYKNIRPLGTLRFAIENWTGKTALFTEQGKPITEFEIDSISIFKNNVAVIYQNLKQGLMNREGEIKIKPSYREIKITPEDIIGRMPTEWKVLDGENHELTISEADDLIPAGDQLHIITKSGKYGVADSLLKIVILLEYDYLTRESNGNFIAKKNKQYGLIRINNSILLPLRFDTLTAQGNLIRVKENELGKSGWAVYDTFGIRKTTRAYDWIGPYNGKYFPVQNHGYAGAVNRYGEEFIHCVYDSLLAFFGEQISVKFKGLSGIINFNEEWLVKPQLLRLKLLNEDRYLQFEDKMVFLKDFEGKTIYFTDNKIKFKVDFMIETLPDGIEKTVDYDGRISARTSTPMAEYADEILPESEGLRGFKRDGKYGFIDERGRLRIANRYEAIQPFKEGMAAVKLNHKWGFINSFEKLIIQPTYDSVGEFIEGAAVVKRANQFGILRKDGKLILTNRYDSIIRISSQQFIIISKALQGLADKEGQVLIEPKYDNITVLENNYLIAERDGKFGLISLNGLSTIPLVYDQLIYLPQKNQYLAKKQADWKKIDY